MYGERGYLNLLNKLLRQGVERPDRTGVGTIGLFAEQLRFDLAHGLPLLTTKKVHFPSVLEELLWFLRGETNTATLKATIWDEWGPELGPIYGKQWRRWTASSYNRHGYVGPQYVDQIQQLIDGLKSDPYGRRHIVTAWNPAEVPDAALPPCHLLFQMYVSEGKLSCHFYMRSADVFLGVPFNLASYGLLTMMVAKVVGLQPGELVCSMTDCHLYKNHVDQAYTQLSRWVRTPPQVTIPRREDIFAYQTGDFTLVGYDPAPAIKAEVAV